MRENPTDIDNETHGGTAVVGMACRAPGAHGVDEYWNLLTQGVDAICDVPSNRFRVDETTDLRMRRGGFIDNVAGFDAEFFSISPREAEAMDPQQRLLLECVWEAFEDAGHPRSKWQGTSTGVFDVAVGGRGSGPAGCAPNEAMTTARTVNPPWERDRTDDRPARCRTWFRSGHGPLGAKVLSPGCTTSSVCERVRRSELTCIKGCSNWHAASSV
ncbi:hypothetical protein ABH922_005342 [Rhodococcus sp. 27YEA15]